MTISGSSHIILRQRYENEYGRIKDCSYPCHTMVERRLEELEQGEIVAEALSDVICVEEAIDEVAGAMLDKDGALRMVKTTKKVPLPASSEELRNRIKILGVSFQLAAYKHFSRKWLTQMKPSIWQDHLDYILGSEIYGLKVQVMNRVIEAPWLDVLHFEHQLRKSACRKMMFENYTMADSMEAVRRDSATKEMYFSTPVSMAASLPKQVQNPPNPNKRKYDKDGKLIEGKGKKGGGRGGKGGKDGKGKGTKSQFPNTKTPDGRLICFRYQDGLCTAGKKCKFVHVCARCLATHPMSECGVAAEATPSA
jgi:hypothetical protein